MGVYLKGNPKYMIFIFFWKLGFLTNLKETGKNLSLNRGVGVFKELKFQKPKKSKI